MDKKLVLIVGVLFWAGTLFAQQPKVTKWIWGPSAGWKFQSGNFLTLSGWGLFAPNDYQYLKIDAGANFTWMQKQTTVIPELGVTYYLSDKLIFPFLGGEITPYTITPKVGVGIFSLIDIGVGYGWEIRRKSGFKTIQGVSGSIKFNIPLNFHLY